MWGKVFILIVFPFIFMSCNDSKENNTISFIRLHPNILFDTIGNPYLHIEQYVEYRFFSKDSLYIGKSEINEANGKEYLQFGLSKFYSKKIDNNFSRLMEKILSENYAKLDENELEECSVDDRYMNILVINKAGVREIVMYGEEERLPENLRLANELIDEFVKSVNKGIDKPNYSIEIITSLQDSLFHKFPPPLKPTIKIVPPMIDDDINKKQISY